MKPRAFVDLYIITAALNQRSRLPEICDFHGTHPSDESPPNSLLNSYACSLDSLCDNLYLLWLSSFPNKFIFQPLDFNHCCFFQVERVSVDSWYQLDIWCVALVPWSWGLSLAGMWNLDYGSWYDDRLWEYMPHLALAKEKQTTQKVYAMACNCLYQL